LTAILSKIIKYQTQACLGQPRRHLHPGLLSSLSALSSVLRPLQHSIGYMGDGFYRSKDPTNGIKVLKDK